MKKAYLADLQAELAGSVTDVPEALDYFATDGSVFQQKPAGVIYPRNTADVRRSVNFLAAKAKSGKTIGITARGKGTDQSGAAIGAGVVMVFPAHMNQLLRLDNNSVTVQPGINYGSLQQILQTHGRFLPPYPSSINFSTIGGAVANNAAGEKSVKYGSTKQWVKSLKVVLADGSLIEAKRLTPRELNRKKGQADLEGQIYRGLDGLITDNAKAITAAYPKTSKNSAGYDLARVKAADGSFNLVHLLVGSQGTLGIVTEVTLVTAPFNARTTLMVGFFDDLARAGEAINRLVKLHPSALELVDYHLLDFMRRHRPADIQGLVPENLPKLVLLIEFDDVSQLQQTLKGRRAEHLLKKYATSSCSATNPIQQQALWKLRRSAAAVIWMNHGPRKALPVIEDGIVPLDRLPQFLREVYKLLKKHNLEIAVWGHAGDANLHLQPFIDLSKKHEVDKLFKVADDFYDLVIKLGGSVSGEHNDGLMRGPYLAKLYGEEVYGLFREVKQLFDPQNIMNPGKKIDVTQDMARASLRSSYSLKHLYDHLPHS